MEISGGKAAASLVKNNASAITTSLNTVPGFITAIQPGGSKPVSTIPQAFLTILFFDERFNFIAAADGGVAQQQVAASVTADGSTLVRNDIKAPKNGYAYVYISNQSNVDVFFDNLKVQVVTGNIIEENHYYSYGLKIAAISSKKLGDTYEGTLKNSYLYNDKELFEDGDLNWYDYGFRFYDPQIGRFTQLDPLTDKYSFYTPYQFAGCEPIANVDLDGLEPWNVLKAIGKAASDGGTSITSKVLTTGADAGKWAITWFKDGVAFSKVLKATGFFTDAVVNAAKAIGSGLNAVNTASNILQSSSPGGDLAQSNRVISNSQAQLNEYGKALDQLEYQIDNGWKKIEHRNPGEQSWQLGEVNHITGEKRYLPTAADPIYPESIAVPLPKIGIALAWLARIGKGAAIKGSSKILLNTSRQLQSKFKHAGDFGVVGNYNKANAGKFSSAINQHINSAEVQTINGTYRGQSVVHYLNPNTGLNVISSPSGQFISGWKLNSSQLQNVLTHGGL